MELGQVVPIGRGFCRGAAVAAFSVGGCVGRRWIVGCSDRESGLIGPSERHRENEPYAVEGGR